MKKISYILIILCSLSTLTFAADNVPDQKIVNTMMVVKSAKTIGEEGLKVVTNQGIYSANIYHVGSKGYDLILKSKKDKSAICFNDITKNPEKKNQWFFEDVQPKCS